jgi:hypothetical protein
MIKDLKQMLKEDVKEERLLQISKSMSNEKEYTELENSYILLYKQLQACIGEVSRKQLNELGALVTDMIMKAEEYYYDQGCKDGIAFMNVLIDCIE